MPDKLDPDLWDKKTWEDWIYLRFGFYPSWIIRGWWWANRREALRLRFKGPRMLHMWYDIVSSLPLTLGNTLVHWADNSHGAPMGKDFDEWENEIRKHGEALLAWYEEENEENYKGAQEALHWVADNLSKMWD